MKKITLLLILISISIFSFSQSTGNIKYGLFAGVNIAQISVSIPGYGTAYSPSKVGPDFGIMVELPAAKYFSVQAELAYASLGWKDNATLYADSLSINNPRYNLNYLRIPLLIKLKIPPTIRNGNGLAVYVGPQVGYLANANIKGSNSNGSMSIKDGFTSIDYSVIGGAEYFLPNGIGISARYQFGLSNILGSEANDAFKEMFGTNASVKNRSVAITIGYRF